MSTAPFDDQPVLAGPTLALHPLAEDDRAGLTAAAVAPETWAGHPATERHRAEVFAPYFDFLLEAGGTLVVTDRARERIIGCSRYYTAPDRPGTISIGFTFLDHRYWGGAANREMKALMLGHAFARFDAVWFHIAPSNIRSQRATEKLGARRVEAKTLDLGSGPVEWLCYRLERADWQARAPQSNGVL